MTVEPERKTRAGLIQHTIANLVFKIIDQRAQAIAQIIAHRRTKRGRQIAAIAAQINAQQSTNDERLA